MGQHLLNGEYFVILVVCTMVVWHFGHRYVEAISQDEQRKGWAILLLGIAIAFAGHAIDYVYWYIARAVPGWYGPMSQNLWAIAAIKGSIGLGAAIHLRLVFSKPDRFFWPKLFCALILVWLGASYFSYYLSEARNG